MKSVVLAGLALAVSACAPHPRTAVVYCISPEQLDEQRRAEPPKVSGQLTGKADEDIRPIAGSALRLRAWGDGLLGILDGCSGSSG